MKKTFLLISLLCLTLLFPAAAFAQKDTIRLGVPPLARGHCQNRSRHPNP